MNRKSDLRNGLDSIKKYAEAHSSSPPEYLVSLERATHLRTLAPQMISGHLQGRLLSMISHMIRPSAILEIGTFTGYATLCLAEGLTTDGKIHTIEINKELVHGFAPFLDNSPYQSKIIQHAGDALKIIPGFERIFDLVFIDASKTDYKEFFDLSLDRTVKGGFILVDNVLWSGKVCKAPMDTDTKSIDDFNKMVLGDDRVENMILPIRDGLMLCRKK